MDQIYDDNYLIARLCDVSKTKCKKYTPPKPIIVRQNRKTHIMNFTEICESLTRDSLTVKMYIEKSLGIESSITQSGCLVISKIYADSKIIGILSEYIKNHVLCDQPNCKNRTNIIKEGKITYLLCESCLSKRSLM